MNTGLDGTDYLDLKVSDLSIWFGITATHLFDLGC